MEAGLLSLLVMKPLHPDHPTPIPTPAYTTVEICKASAIVWIGLVGLMVTLSYPTTVGWVLVGMLAGVTASRAGQMREIRPYQRALATIVSHVGQRHDRSL